MAKPSKSSKSCWPEVKAPKAPSRYRDRNLAAMQPAKAESMIPTEAVPVRLQKRMAGGG